MVNVTTQIETAELVRVVANGDYRDIIDFIREVEFNVGDSEFTDMLAELANELKAESDSAFGEEF